MPNRLKDEQSPYLRQHMNNPIDWYPWGEEAFDKARREDKPVFLSIGYSTCHWCHVMARESFEDGEVARVLNEFFVSVKVDREERPDVDSVYMRFCTALTGSGGWPLTVIMTPEQRPFFAGTYLPRENVGGRIGLLPLLRAVAYKWAHNRAELENTAAELTAELSKPEAAGGEKSAEALLSAAAEQFRASYDAEYGGFGRAPKFPSAHNLIFLLRLSKLSGDKSLRAMAENTLRQMYRGGIYDHIGGGFCRYSTDREWLAPHFEKTLYDNALLALCYTEAWQDGHMALYRDVAESTLDYCLRELKAPEGGFYCAQDADSEGTEGAYYLLTPEDVKGVLGEEQGRHFCECYDITPEGNFNGRSIPNLLLNTRWSFLPEGYDEFRERLRIFRAERLPLDTDDKILAAWNGLMLMALSRAAAAFGDRRYLMEAKALAEFIASRMTEGGKLKARLCKGELRFEARLEDYAFCALGLLELYGADFDARHILSAQDCAGEIVSRFADAEGGFFSTAADAEELVLRPKERFDGAMPSGNSAATVLFDLLGRYTGRAEWREAAARQTAYIRRGAGEYPAGCAFGLLALLSEVYGTREIVCALPDECLPDSAKAILARYAPELAFLVKTPANAEALAAIAPFTADMDAQGGRAAYYACSGGSCSLPVVEE